MTSPNSDTSVLEIKSTTFYKMSRETRERLSETLALDFYSSVISHQIFLLTHNSSRYAGPGGNMPLRNKPTTPKDGRTYMGNTTQLPPRSFGYHAATRSSRTAGGTCTLSPQLYQGSLHIPCSYRLNTWFLEHQRRNQTFLYQQWEN